MNKYLIESYSWSMSKAKEKGIEKEHDTLELAIQALKDAEFTYGPIIVKDPAIHRAGWRYWAIVEGRDYKPNPFCAASGLPGYSEYCHARIYEIETDGTAQSVWDEWQDEQRRITMADEAEAVTMAVDAFKARGLDLEGHLTFDGDVYSGERWKLGEAFLLNMFEFLIPPQARDEKINFGRVRVTVEPLEVESGEDEQ